VADEKPKPDEGVIPRYSYNPVPTLYADGVANVAHGPGMVRTYLVRFDPSLIEAGNARPSLVAQLIMPTNGFLTIALFFEAQVKSMLKSGDVTEAQIAEVRHAIVNLANGTD
jgi:hypothetical protein